MTGNLSCAVLVWIRQMMRMMIVTRSRWRCRLSGGRLAADSADAVQYQFRSSRFTFLARRFILVERWPAPRHLRIGRGEGCATAHQTGRAKPIRPGSASRSGCAAGGGWAQAKLSLVHCKRGLAGLWLAGLSLARPMASRQPMACQPMAGLGRGRLTGAGQSCGSLPARPLVRSMAQTLPASVSQPPPHPPHDD